jgi:hypothetical protein
MQSLAALRGILLADRTRLGSLNLPLRGRSETSGRDDILLGLLIVAALMAAIWALSRLLAMGTRHRAYDSPRRLFLSLCKAHRLRWSEWWLLWRLARSQGLKDPARIFLEPERFGPGGLRPKLAARAERLRGIRDRLFTEPPNEKPEPTTIEAGLPQGGHTEPLSATPPPTPLLPAVPGPTLDVPPWPQEQIRG